MTQDQHTEALADHVQTRRRLLPRNIRWKIAFPYLILTLVIALIGTYVVIWLVAGSLDERLDNHLLESGRAVLNSLALQELKHIDSLQIVRSTRGVAEALSERDADRLWDLAMPAAETLNMDTLIVVASDGEVMLHMLRTPEGLEPVDMDFNSRDVWIIDQLLNNGDPSGLPRRGIGRHRPDGPAYYFTALPVAWDESLAGVVMVGTLVDDLLPIFKSTALAEVVIYQNEGRAIATTLPLYANDEDKTQLLEELKIASLTYKAALERDDATLLENNTVRGRDYRIARGPLTVGGDKVAVFAVALTSDFIAEKGSLSRRTYLIIFSAAAVGVVFLGYLIAQRITRPLDRLVRISKAVAEGDLEQRTGIESQDEVGVLADNFDVMTTRLAERSAALRESLRVQEETASRMRSILLSIGDGVLLEDLEGNFIPLNAAARKMLEDMATNFKYGPLREFSLAGDEQEPVEHNPWLLDSRRLVVGDKVFTVHSAVVRTKDGKKLGTVIVIRDVTLEVQAEQLKDAFVAHVSHELRTPLTSIKGYTALLLATTGAVLSDDQRGFLNMIIKHTDTLVTMINALLDFSEVEASGRLGLRLKPLDFRELLMEVVEDWENRMKDKVLTFSTEIPEDVPTIYADGSRLRWAVINIIQNAYQYTSEGGEVTLRVTSQDDHVMLDVIDTGIGISPENQRRLFSRFHRVMQKADDEIPGLGIGLSVTKAIVEAHGGDIHVVSEEGQGSTFTIELPIRSREISGQV